MARVEDSADQSKISSNPDNLGGLNERTEDPLSTSNNPLLESLEEIREAMRTQAQTMLVLLVEYESRLKERIEAAETRIAQFRDEQNQITDKSNNPTK